MFIIDPEGNVPVTGMSRNLIERCDNVLPARLGLVVQPMDCGHTMPHAVKVYVIYPVRVSFGPIQVKVMIPARHRRLAKVSLQKPHKGRSQYITAVADMIFFSNA